MTPNKVFVPDDNTLAQINSIVDQTEAIVGPLIAIGNDGVQTVLTFDSDPPAPTKSAVILPDAGAKTSVPAASDRICSGVIFISGVLTASTAFRPR